MLTEPEKNALLHLLSVLNDHKLKSLARSITEGKIHSKTREDAISCLLLHSESLISVLNNKKISTTVLLNYLHQVKVEAPGNATKEVLLERVFNVWKLPYSSYRNNDTGIQMNNNVTISSPVNSIPSTSNPIVPQMSFQPYNNPNINANNSLINTNASVLAYNQPNQMNINPFQQQNMHQSQFNTHQIPSLQFSAQNMANHQISQNSMTNNALQPFNPQKSINPSLSQSIASYQLLKEVNMLAFDEFMVNFAKMFYELFNSTSDSEYLHGLNKSHFFEECKMVIIIKGSDENIENIGENVVDVLKLLSDLKRVHQLIFSPNLSPEGVRGKTDSHGLIYAVASGTLHQGRGQLVGVFEQSFILRKDPFEQNSCKIWESTLITRSSHAVESYSQLLLPSSKKTNERNLAIQSGANQASHPLQLTYFNS